MRGETEQCQVAIVGGGPAGSTVGRILAAWGMDVLVVDAGPGQGSGEVIGPEAASLLEVLDLASLLANRPDLAVPCQGTTIRGPSGRLERFDYRGRGLAWTVDRAMLAEALRALAQANGCRWARGRVVGRPRKVAHAYDLCVVDTCGPRLLRTSFVIDATGRPARIARRLGACRRTDDRLVAVAVAQSGPCTHWDPYLRIDLLAEGWSYRIDGPGGLTHAAFVTDSRALGTGRQGLHEAARNLAPASGEADGHATPAFLDASSAVLDRCVGEGWLAVGDAATSFDPFSGQGLAHALGSALAASHALRKHWAGAPDALSTYAEAMDLTYRHSRKGLRLSYAHQASLQRTAFWWARASLSGATARPDGTRSRIVRPSRLDNFRLSLSLDKSEVAVVD